jgi:DNA (cytosine-5)-methyltransferase 1
MRAEEYPDLRPTKMPRKDERTFSVVSVFSGIGGLDMGFSGGFEYRGGVVPKLNMNVVKAYEKDQASVETFRLNHSIPIEQVELDTESPAFMPSADILIGGFPCQDFSSCGPKLGLSSNRGQLFRVMSEYLRVHQPIMMVAENVPHLARMQDGAVLRHISSDFEAQGYRVVIWNLFAPDFGIPQNRRRIFFVCVRKDIDGMPVPPVPEFVFQHRSIEWAIGDLVGVDPASVNNQTQFFRASRAKRGNGQGDETSRATEPAYTVRANAKSRVQYHYQLERRLTVRECARIQTFGDSFQFPHSATTNIMQIGNAVPPLLASVVGRSVSDFLRKLEVEGIHGSKS